MQPRYEWVCTLSQKRFELNHYWLGSNLRSNWLRVPTPTQWVSEASLRSILERCFFWAGVVVCWDHLFRFLLVYLVTILGWSSRVLIWITELPIHLLPSRWLADCRGGSAVLPQSKYRHLDPRQGDPKFASHHHHWTKVIAHESFWNLKLLLASTRCAIFLRTIKCCSHKKTPATQRSDLALG